jgi:hypothetical protein
VLEIKSAASAIAVKPSFTSILQWAVVSFQQSAQKQSPIAYEFSASNDQRPATTAN